MENLKELQRIAKDFSILYVEDNEALRQKAAILLGKFFNQVDVASNGEEGWKTFQKIAHPIVVTDIKMPKMDGLALAKRIKEVAPETKVIIMTAYDAKHLLLQGIEYGVFRFLTKPVNVDELATVLLEAVQIIESELDSNLFYANLQKVVNYQSVMVTMVRNRLPIFANQPFLDFFAVESVEEFNNLFPDLTDIFLPQDGFLHKEGGMACWPVLEKNANKLFHAKVKDNRHQIRHFIVKYQKIPEKEDVGILSLDDVSELNLLELFEQKRSERTKIEIDTDKIQNLLHLVADNQATIEVHNYYKGLGITHNATIQTVEPDSLVICTSYLQQKAIQLENQCYLVSEAFPRVLFCDTVKQVNFETNEVTLAGLSFVESSPVDRKTIRVVPEEGHAVTLLIRKHKFHGDVTIADISLEGVRLHLNAMPAGFDKGDEAVVDMVFTMDKRPLIINKTATLYKKWESQDGFDIVLLFLDDKKNDLAKYITRRQMAIIKEFKGL
jgi:CheY-like chemotaxis protein